MASYVADVPEGISFDPEYRKFFENFYAISDTPGAHEQYANQFTPDATVIMASKRVQGTAEIIKMREAMAEAVATRKHVASKIYPFGSDSEEVMLYGTVAYVLKDGRKATVDWAARGHLVKADKAVKMDFYQVYLDTAAQNAAK